MTERRITLCGSTVFADGFAVAELLLDVPATVADAFARALAETSTSKAYASERDIARPLVNNRHARPLH